MLNLNEFITFEYESAYDLQMTKNFSNPNIYIASGDLTKRWYVYFSYRNPETGKLKGVTPIYGNVNKFKTKEERLYVLSAYRKKLLQILKAGFNPFEDNTDLYKKYKSEEGAGANEPTIEVKGIGIGKKIQPDKLTKTLKEAFEFALSLKEKLVSAKTITGYRSRLRIFCF